MELPVLNLPSCGLRVRKVGQSKQIFDLVRRKYVALTPEEWVRQNFINFLTSVKGYPASLFAVEMQVNVFGLCQRADIVVYSRQGKPWMIVECKSPSVTLTHHTFYQAARYTSALKVPYIVMTNGLRHYCLHFNGISLDFLEDLPDYHGHDVE
jgi:hypothetical protein